MNAKSTGTQAAIQSEWIDRYINEVGRRLSGGQRADVEREIRSLIEDEVAARLESQPPGALNQAATDDAVLAVLDQFGSPASMAAHYRPPRYLIGPGLFPIFRVVLLIVLAINLFANLLVLALATGEGQPPPVGETLTSIFGNLFQAAGTVVVIFALVEYFVGAVPAKQETWNARSLPPVKDPDRIKVWELSAEIGFDIAGLVLFNFYLAQLSGIVFTDGGVQRFPIFAPEFAQFVPWLSAFWLLDILVTGIVLARGRWQPALRWATVVVSSFGALILLFMLRAPSLAGVATFDPLFKLVIAIVLTVTLLDIVRQVWTLVSGYMAAGPGSTAHLQTHG